MSKVKSFVKKILEGLLAFLGLLKRGETMGLDSAILPLQKRPDKNPAFLIGNPTPRV